MPVNPGFIRMADLNGWPFFLYLVLEADILHMYHNNNMNISLCHPELFGLNIYGHNF